ncbi:MAG: hypothetical protein JSU73_00080, partial [candidate division WOR-3 bacterium]
MPESFERSTMTRLPEIEYKLLSALAPGVAVGVEGLVKESGLDQSLVMAAAKSLSDKGLVEIHEQVREEYAITEEGLKVSREGLPEKRALQAVIDKGGEVAFQDLPALLGREDVRAEVKWLTKKGWCRRVAGRLVATDKGRAALSDAGPDEVFVCRLAQMGRAFSDDLASLGTDVEAGLAALKGRSGLFKRKQRTARSISLTDAGSRLKNEGIEPAQEVTQLTPELIVSGEWRGVAFKEYDPRLETAVLRPGKAHP